MLNSVLSALCVFGVAAALQSRSASGEQQDVPSTIVAMERAALDRSDKNDVEGFLEISDPEVTYIDPTLDQPIHGLEALRTYYHGMPGAESVEGVMSNTNVQVSGDIAVLTFNYTTTTEKTGRVTRWNSTEVYRRGPQGWRIIHTHWSCVKPQLAESK